MWSLLWWKEALEWGGDFWRDQMFPGRMSPNLDHKDGQGEKERRRSHEVRWWEHLAYIKEQWAEKAWLVWKCQRVLHGGEEEGWMSRVKRWGQRDKGAGRMGCTREIEGHWNIVIRAMRWSDVWVLYSRHCTNTLYMLPYLSYLITPQN